MDQNQIHITQAIRLLEQTNPPEIYKAINHLASANRNLHGRDRELWSPIVLYYLSLANAFCDETHRSYVLIKRAQHAQRQIERLFPNEQNWPIAGAIDRMVERLDGTYGRTANMFNPFVWDSDEFDENLIPQGVRPHQSNTKRQVAHWVVEDDETIRLIGDMLTTNSDLDVFFNVYSGKVQCFFQGYLLPVRHKTDLKIERFHTLISQQKPFDSIEGDEHIPIPKIGIGELMEEIKVVSRQPDQRHKFFQDFRGLLAQFGQQALAMERMTIDEVRATNDLINSMIGYYQSMNVFDIMGEIALESEVGKATFSLAKRWVSNLIKTDEEPFLEKPNSILLEDINFESPDHLRFEDGVHVSGPHDGGAGRAVKIEPNIQGGAGYSVSVINLDGVHPLFGSNVQIAPKPMKVISENSEQTVLRGFGSDPRAMGHPEGEFSHYGVTIHHPKGKIQYITLHMHDRNVDIQYMGGS